KIRGAVLKGVENSQGGEGILMGSALANEFGLEEGGSVSLLLDYAKQRKEKLPVTGLFKTGLFEIDDNFAILDLKTIAKLFPGIEKNIGLEIWLDDPFQADKVAQNLREEFPALDIRDWMELNQPIFSAFTLEKWFFRIFIGLMVFVAAMNLVGAVLLSIFQRKPEIAILRVLGQSPRKICLLFAVEGFYLGGIAIAAGTFGALIFLWCLQRYSLVAIDPEIYFLERLPVALHWPELVALLLSCLALVVFISRWVAGRVKNLPLREGLHKVG
ncbi:MAG: FtsX-like permease family protein, partial [Deltaproteobacteria bacterium]|nr:FtsX-like permease family protein [Deltaproteobacteria bacterium]